MSKKDKILVIEDDHKIRNVVVAILEENNFEVFACSDGKSGIKLAESLKPLVILCDIMLPDIEGYAVCKQIRNSEITSDSIFIFLTAKAELNDIRKGMNFGADDYITKPFKANDLLDAVSVRIQKYNSQKLHSDDFEKELNKESKILVNLKNESKLIRVDSISAISAEGVYTNIWTNNGEKYLLRRSVSDWEKALPDDLFIRTHRSYIINQDNIEKIEPWYKHSFLVRVRNINEDFFISERYATKLRKRFSF